MDGLKNIYGLIGEKLSHSYSPIIHNEILKRINIDGEYVLFEVERGRLKEKINELKYKVKGLNVTIPYKVEVVEFLDEVSEEAKKIGAINTIDFKDNLLVGYNTDYYGFKAMLDVFNIDIKNKGAVVLGSGGASKAVIHSLLDNGIGEVVLVSRDKIRVEVRFKGIKCIDYSELKHLRNYDYIINCTPVGMYPNIDFSPVDKDILQNYSVAIDLIYNPTKTLFLKKAEEIGIKAVNGLYMLVAQAVKSEEIWNGVNIDKEYVFNIFTIIKNNIEHKD
jgi:shikimate dehydrogenase